MNKILIKAPATASDNKKIAEIGYEILLQLVTVNQGIKSKLKKLNKKESDNPTVILSDQVLCKVETIRLRAINSNINLQKWTMDDLTLLFKLVKFGTSVPFHLNVKLADFRMLRTYITENTRFTEYGHEQYNKNKKDKKVLHKKLKKEPKTNYKFR